MLNDKTNSDSRGGWDMGTIKENDSTGFETESSVSIHADALDVFNALEEISKWWDSHHSFSLDAKNLSLSLEVGGHFMEDMGGGQGVIHSTVIFSKRGELLRMSGALGPLQVLGAHGTLTLIFKQCKGGVELHANYVVIGRNLEQWAAPVEQVLYEQLIRLKNFVETGAPELTSD